MLDPTLNRLDELWRLRLSNARLRLEFARSYVKEVHRDLEKGTVPSADGTVAFERAVRAENLALAEYNRVLRIFTDLVVRRIIPDEDQARHPQRGVGLTASRSRQA